MSEQHSITETIADGISNAIHKAGRAANYATGGILTQNTDVAGDSSKESSSHTNASSDTQDTSGLSKPCKF